jgi:uncharacterized protein
LRSTQSSQTPAAPCRSLLLSLFLLRSCQFVRKPWLYNLSRLAVASLYLYFAGVLFLMMAEDRLVFRTLTAAEYWKPPPPGLDPRDVEFISADGTRLHGWWITPPNWEPEQGALLSCHGKGGNLSIVGSSALQWRNQLNVAVLLFDYPGYGYSDGQPSEASCYAAADAAYAWLRDVQQVPAQRLLIHGQSLGGAVAVDLASRRPHRALILSSTFTTFPDAAQSTVPFAPAKWLAHNQFRSLDKIAQITTPIFIVHGTADHTVPYWQGERLFAAATSTHKRFLRIDGGPHNLDHTGDVQRAVRAFLRDVDAQTGLFSQTALP